MSPFTLFLPNEKLQLVKDQLLKLLCLFVAEGEREAESDTNMTVTFLLTTESFSLEDGNLSSLEEVREKYVKRHFSSYR